MAKSKIITSVGSLTAGMALDVPIISAEHSRSPRIVDVKPTGSQVLVEILTAQELANTNITVSESSLKGVPLQGYIRSVGPRFRAEDWGYDVGNRVLISGSGVLAPTYDDTHRDRFFMEPTAIKSVLLEE